MEPIKGGDTEGMYVANSTLELRGIPGSSGRLGALEATVWRNALL